MNSIGRRFIRLSYNGFFGNVSDSGMYEQGADRAVNFGQGIWVILSEAAVYCSGIALMAAIIYLFWYINRPDKLKESKDRVSRVCLIIIAISSVTGIISLVQTMALKP